MAFPETPLDLRAELQLGGGERVDITSRVYTRDPIRIISGMSAEGTQVDPSTCVLTLNNGDGALSPRNPLGPWFGRLGRNTRLQISVPSTDAYLDLDGDLASMAATPDHASLDITGDLDLRVELATDWNEQGRNQVLVSKWDAGGQRSYALRLLDRMLSLGWTTDGTTVLAATAALPPLPERAAVRVTLDVDNGASGRVARFYTAPSLDGPWTVFAEFTQAGATSIFAGTAPLRIGGVDSTTVPPRVPVRGRVYRVQVRAGIDGAVVADVDARGLAPGVTGWTDGAGRPWTLSGTASVRQRDFLFTGEISSLPSRWSPSGQDVWVPMEAAGILRRLGQGRKPIDSTLRRRIPTDPNLIAYWPMEDGPASTTAASPLPGVAPMAVTGLEFAAVDSLGGSGPLPQVRAPASIRAAVPRSPEYGWHVELVYFLPVMPAAQTEIIRVDVVNSPSIRQVIVYASTAGVRIEARNEDAEVIAGFTYTEPQALADFAGVWNRLAIYSGPGSAGFRLFARWRNIIQDTFWIISAIVPSSTLQGAVTGVSGAWGTAVADMTVGHLAVFDQGASEDSITSPPGSTIFAGADDGFAGESALNRLNRLTAEEPTVPIAWYDGDTSRLSEQMGSQRPAVLTALVADCAEVDGGILSERPDRIGLWYRDRASMENQTPTLVLDYAAGHVAPPLEPVEDDQRIRNDVTVERIGGSSARVVIEEGPLGAQPPEQGGVGIYDESISLNLAADDRPQQHASWRAHLGTWDAPRFPSVRVLLHQQPQLIPDVLRLRIGDKIRIVGLPLYAGAAGEPVDLLVQQITHIPLPRTWEVTLVCTPAGPWTVGVEGTARADTAGSQLAVGVSATATALSVTTTTGPRWMTSAARAGDFPFDIRAGGEVMTVTGITGTSSTQTFTVTRAVNGISKTHTAGTDVRLAHPAIVAL
ncbi:hypothetical protein [Streptomyces jumonjinensis]|uniref:Uncharacterized protein n=1 Tax=Streptomyces jumonjinensis TaxID=1945 RepID=A0A646KNF3_STRJU|nr:hypothetical protein [Streptomyces jumonjinensis]MQT03854.1 hypothetical protein [Streptomyces jumonjinensis]